MDEIKHGKLICADRLAYEAEHCIETTDAFIELINKMPLVNIENGSTYCESCYRYEICMKQHQLIN